MPYTFARSQELFQRAQRSIAAGVNSGIRKMEAPVPLYFTHGSGPNLWDADGNHYVDFQLGQGALLYGHAPAGQADAIAAQARLGTHWAAQCELEIEVAERLQAMIPSAELMRFNNSASEVVQVAFRLARGHTGRPLILRFEGHYHGWTDEGLAGFASPPDRWGDDENPAVLHPSRGVIPAVTEQFVVARWNDPEHLRRRVDQFRGRIAAVVFEPVLCNTCCIEPVAGLMDTIRELCDRDGMLMIADETITGFRFGASCAQGYYGFRPDLSIFGKAVGGGTPFAALAGTRAAMAKILSGEVVHAGTLNGNPLCLAASKWSLDQVLALGTEHPARIQRLGRRLMAGLIALADRHGVPLRPQGPGLIFHTVMLKPGAAEGPVRDYRDYVRRHDAPRWAHLRRCLLEEGVRAIERGLWSVSLAHGEGEIDDALGRAARAFARHARTLDMNPRILLGGLFHETHTFLPEPTHWEDFTVTRGADILAQEGDESPMAGFLGEARRWGWDVVPTVDARAIPSGPVADEAFERFWGEFETRARPALTAGIDAIFLVLHGAMATPTIEDAEGEFLTRLRALPGAAALPLFGVLDLHANVSARMCALASGLVTYRKNPHTDAKITTMRTAGLLQRCLRSGRVPHMHWCRVPILWAPPGTGTQTDPMLSLTLFAQKIEATDPSVWSYNVAPGFSFADTAETGVTLTVVADAESARARDHLKAGARLAWELREKGLVQYPPVDVVLAQIGPAPSGPVLLVEPADNIGGGAPGDGTGVLRALLQHRAERALVAINDPQAVSRLADAPIGAAPKLAIGGRGWRLDPGPVEIEATLVSRGSGAFQLEDVHSHLASLYGARFDMGPCAVVRHGGVTILLTSRKTMPFDLGQYRSQGIDPRAYSIIGVKAAVAHRQAYDPIARASYFVDTAGPCSSNLATFAYRRLRRPVYPLDPAAEPTMVVLR